MSHHTAVWGAIRGEGDFPGALDVHLMTSRDGVKFERSPERAPFLRRGLTGSGSSAGVYCNPWLIPAAAGSEIWLYYSGTGR